MILNRAQLHIFQELFNSVCNYDFIDLRGEINMYKIKLKKASFINERTKLLGTLLEQNILKEFIQEREHFLKFNTNVKQRERYISDINDLNYSVSSYTITFEWDVASHNSTTNITNWRDIMNYVYSFEDISSNQRNNVVKRKNNDIN